MSKSRDALQKKKFEDLLFEYATTTLTDFREGEIVSAPKQTQQIKQPEQKSTPTGDTYQNIPRTNIHTLSRWTCYVPFNALHRPKGIVDTNPNVVPTLTPAETKPMKEQALLVRKTRPRVILSPQVSVDDVGEPARSILMWDTYTSEMNAKNREALAGVPACNVKAGFPASPAPARPIMLPKVMEPVVPPEWRMETLEWDRKQLRLYCDPTEKFWTSRPLNKCLPCEQTAQVKAQRDLVRAMKHGK